KCLTITGASARIHVQHTVTSSGVNLVRQVEPVAVHPVRSTVNLENQRRLLSGLETRWLHYPAFDFRVVEALKSNVLRFHDIQLSHELLVELSDLSHRTAGIL